MSTLNIDLTGDYDFSSGGFKIVKEPVAELVIKLRYLFLFFRGEWFLDKREGVPYFELILVKAPEVRVIKRIFQEIITSTGGDLVESTAVDVIYDPSTRSAIVNFSARLIDGRVLEGGFGRPFLVNGEPLEGYSL
jgi:hypothetical protein